MILTVIVGAVGVAGGSRLNADGLAPKVVNRSNGAVLFDDDDLSTGCI